MLILLSKKSHPHDHRDETASSWGIILSGFSILKTRLYPLVINELHDVTKAGGVHCLYLCKAAQKAIKPWI